MSLKKLVRFIKGRWFPFLLLLIGLAFVLLGGFLLGFRITYAPTLENSWEAISGVAAWVGILVSIASVGASLAAVWAAIQVPKKIAEKQNSISLFEKRFECYTMIQNLMVCATQMENAKTNKEVQVSFRLYLGNPENILENQSGTIFIAQLKQKQAVLLSGAFLFPKYNVEILQHILNTGLDLITNVIVQDANSSYSPLSDKAVKLKEEYCQLCREFEEQYIESMEKELELNKIK